MNNKDIIKAFYTALFQNDDIGRIEPFIFDDTKWHIAHPVNKLSGIDEFHSNFLLPLKSALADLEYRPFVMLEGVDAGKQWVASTGYFTGTFEKSLYGIPATGKTLYLRFGELACIEDEKISENYIIPDFIDAMNQAGVNPLRPGPGHDGLVMPPHDMGGLLLSKENKGDGIKSLNLVKDMHAGLARYDGNSLASMDQEKFWHPDFMWYGPGGIGTTRGLKGFQNHHQGPFLQGFPDRSVDTSVCYIAEKNYVATGGWPHMSATHTGDGWFDLPATDRSVSMRVMDFWRRDGELLHENWVSIDIVDILLQLRVDVFQLMHEQIKGQERE